MTDETRLLKRDNAFVAQLRLWGDTEWRDICVAERGGGRVIKNTNEDAAFDMLEDFTRNYGTFRNMPVYRGIRKHA